MIESNEYDLIKFSFFKAPPSKPIAEVIGLDTEAYTDGSPFLAMDSRGNEIDLPRVPEFFFEGVPRKKQTAAERDAAARNHLWMNRHFVTYNLKYDSGAILYYIPHETLDELREFGEAFIVRGGLTYFINYIPHKYLSFSCNKFFVKIWDIAQYFKMSLDNATKTYLGKKIKLEIETKEFTPEYVKNHLSSIKKYCLVDCKAAAELGNHFIEKLRKLDISVPSLYSPASLSLEFFERHATVLNVKRFSKYYKDVLKYAIDAYKGGKFEMTGRGYFENAFQYDIVSAYPHEIANLLDFTRARVAFQKEYISEADYGLLRVLIENDGAYIPCAIKNASGVDIYPIGKFYLTITKQEYDYLIKIGVRVKIFSAWWIIIGVKIYPYRKPIDYLFRIKAENKKTDQSLYSISKLMMNSLYGKLLQLIKEKYHDFDATPSIIDGKKTFPIAYRYRAAKCFNPIHGAIITANTRIKVSTMQNFLKSDCLSVHTDSVLSLRPLPPEMAGGKLGEFELQKTGAGVMIACGQYQITDKGAYKGFRPGEEENWIELLKRNANRSKWSQEVRHVEGWYEAISKGHHDKINVFQKEEKIIDLNADTKRIWRRKVTGGDLLRGVEQSAPPVVIHTQKPEGW